MCQTTFANVAEDLWCLMYFGILMNCAELHCGGNSVYVTLRRSCLGGAGPALRPGPLLSLRRQLVCAPLHFHRPLYLCLNGSSDLSYVGMSCQSLQCLTQCWDTKGKRGRYFMNYSLYF